MERVRLGLIGAGGMANGVHYPSLAEIPDAEMVALCDLDPQRLTATADRFGIKRRYASYREMLGNEELDAVYVLMPPYQLFDPVMDAIERKKHVYIEKPFGVTADQARQMAAAAERHGVLTMVAFNRRYAPIIVKAKELVSARGPMIQCVSTFYKNYLGQPPYYRGAIDVLACDAIHAVDMLRFMGGEVVEVASDVQSRKATYANMFNALVRFEDDGVGVLLANWNVGARRHTFEMHAEGISAYCNPDVGMEVYADNKGESQVITTQAAARSDEFRAYYGFAAENRHFIECVKRGAKPQTHFGDAQKSMELAEAIYAAAW